MTVTENVVAEIKGYHRFIKFLILLVVIGTLAALLRFVLGLGATTNLNDTYPWGLWISFDVVTAVPLADQETRTVGAASHCYRFSQLFTGLRRPAAGPWPTAKGLARAVLLES